MKYSKVIFNVIILAIVAIPLLVWFSMFPLGVRFGSASSVFHSMGQISGLLGMALFSVNLVLSARLKFFDKYFEGLNTTYLKHHLIGGISLILLLVHPVTLALMYVSSSVYSAAVFLIPSFGRTDILIGEAALAIMIVTLVITFYGRLKYDLWKLTHKFLGVAFLFSLIHILLVTSDISGNLFLKLYFVTLGLISIGCYVYRSIISKYLVKRTEFTIKEINKLANDSTEIILDTGGEVFKYYSGQFVFLKVEGSQLSSEEHPFSLASSPRENNVRLIIKNLGDYTSKIGSLHVGCGVTLEGPYGKFSYNFTKGKSFIWIAGGVGITPFIGMAKDLREDTGINVDLYYSEGEGKEHIFNEDFLGIAKSQNNFRFFPYISKVRGRITADYIESKSGSIRGKKIFICGPKGMMKSLRSQFVKKGLSSEDVITEEFGF
jgi:predicted ferric reductase